MITIKDYLTASGRYPEREKHPEVTPDLIKAATILLDKVNKLLTDLGIQSVIVSSGFRPASVNAGIANAAKKSNHCRGFAIDLYDPDGSIDELLTECVPLLEKYGLYVEDQESTKGWAHLQWVSPNSGNRFFKP